MLMPKRVKRRRVHRGRMKGTESRGITVAYGDYGLVALDPCWITSNQIEAARIAMTRYTRRGGQVWIKPVSYTHLPGGRRALAVPARAAPALPSGGMAAWYLLPNPGATVRT